MAKPLYFTGQDVTSDDLNSEVTSRVSQGENTLIGLLGRDRTYSHRGGTVGSPGDGTLLVTQAALNQINIAPGTAFTHDGKWLEVPSNPLTSDPLKPTRLGVTWSTGTGTVHVKLRYVEASGSMKADEYGTAYATRYYDSYSFAIETQPPSTDEVLLATFTNNSSNEIVGSTLQDARIWLRAQGHADNVLIEDGPVASHTLVRHHVEAVGTGTPSTTNPHGSSVRDLDDVDAISAESHHRRAHAAGIILYSPNVTDDWRGTISRGASYDSVVFSSPQSGSALIIDGTVINSAPPTLSPSGTLFKTSTYNVVIGISGTASFSPTSSTLTPQQFLVGTVWYDSSNGTLHRSTNGPRDYINDLRGFYVSTQDIIRADFLEIELTPDRFSPLSAITDEGVPSTLVTNLARIRGALQQAHGGGSWKTPPLASVQEIIDRLSTHDHSPASGGGVLKQGGGDLWIARTATRNQTNVPRPAVSGGGTVWFECSVTPGTNQIIVVDNSIDWRDRFINIMGFLIEDNQFLPGEAYKRLIRTNPGALANSLRFNGFFYADLGTLSDTPSFDSTPCVYVASSVQAPGLLFFVANQLFPSNVGNLVAIPLNSYTDESSTNVQGAYPAIDFAASYCLKIEYSPFQREYEIVSSREATGPSDINLT